MYIHLGNGVVVKESSVVGIFDIENTSVSKITKDYLREAQINGRVVYVTSDLPKSFVVCCEGEEIKVYVCQLSPATILKRAEINNSDAASLKKEVRSLDAEEY